MGKLANFQEIASAKIKAGFISVKNIISDNIVTEKLFAKKTVTDELATNIISPLGNKLEINGDVQVDKNLSVAQTLTATDIQTTQIITDNLVAQNIQVTEVTAEKVTANEASVSTLYADQIISKEGSFGDIMAAKISSLRDELKNIVASNKQEATPSAILAESQNWSTSIASDSATIEGDMYLTNNLVVGAQLMVNGDAQFGNAFITGQLSTGDISISGNYIQTTNTALFIQPTNTGSVHIMGDTLVISDNGHVQINGNLSVTGSLFANLLTAAEIETQKLTAAEINSDRINIATDSATILGATDIATDSVSMIVANNNEINLATNSAQLTSNATAGTATLPANKTEIIISTNKLTSNSMVYLTPVGSTNNQVLYVKNKVVTPATDTTPAQSYFTISLDNPLTQDIQVNWWIIN
jgi:cytoskeletal protein CcmA (bactofilin family)